MYKLLFLLLLVGCNTLPQPARIITQEVKVPIAIPCSTVIPTKPEYNIPKLRASYTLYTKVQYILADYELSRGYEILLETTLRSCK